MDITLREDDIDPVIDNDGFEQLNEMELSEFLSVPVQINFSVDIHGTI